MRPRSMSPSCIWSGKKGQTERLFHFLCCTIFDEVTNYKIELLWYKFVIGYLNRCIAVGSNCQRDGVGKPPGSQTA